MFCVQKCVVFILVKWVPSLKLTASLHLKIGAPLEKEIPIGSPPFLLAMLVLGSVIGNSSIAGWNIPIFNRKYIHLQSVAPIFQPAMLDCRSVSVKWVIGNYSISVFVFLNKFMCVFWVFGRIFKSIRIKIVRYIGSVPKLGFVQYV